MTRKAILAHCHPGTGRTVRAMPDHWPAGSSHAAEELTARVIPEQLHGTADPTREPLAIAVEDICAGPDGSICLATRTPGPISEGREDLRTARARGAYLGR
jgi:hypothetical protein